jgi:hypothetical protein
VRRKRIQRDPPHDRSGKEERKRKSQHVTLACHYPMTILTCRCKVIALGWHLVQIPSGQAACPPVHGVLTL